MEENIISVKYFTKDFGTTRVINDLSFEVKRGEIFAFLGANGSGKTTTLRCLLGIYAPSSGELLINGKHYSSKDSSMLGYLPEERGLYVSSKVLDTMVYFGELKGMGKKDARTSALGYLERVGLSDKADTQIKQLSSGQQQKIQLGITVINRPQLLILDEPTKGLDPVNRSLFLELLFDLNHEGSTIVFSTHQMEEAEKIAHRLLMIKKGERKLYGKLNDVKNSFGRNTIHIEIDGTFVSNENLYSFSREGNHVEIQPHEGVSADQILQDLVKNQVSIVKFSVESPSLNEIFIKVSENEN